MIALFGGASVPASRRTDECVASCGSRKHLLHQTQVKTILSPSLRVTIAFFQLEDWPA
jgi:hypothetical protein